MLRSLPPPDEISTVWNKKAAYSSSHVLRECVEEEVPAEELVMGDIIFMKAGDIVPADCRILESNGFTVDNSVITGESEPYELVRVPRKCPCKS